MTVEAALRDLRPVPRFGSFLGKVMAEHVELMRSLGYRYDVNEGMLLRFDRFLQSRAELAGKPLNQLIEVWAQSDLSPNRLCEAKRVGQLISKAMHRLDPAATIFPMSIEMFQPVRREQRRPYVYSNEEMQRLLRAALAFPSPKAPLRPLSLFTMVVLAYCAGLRVGEIVGLTWADVNLQDGTIEIRETKFFKDRRLPREWCDKVNSTYKKHIRAVPRNQFAVERLHLKPLPVWIPEVYRLQQRLVDIEGYVALNSNRYSVPVDWIGRRVEVRETKDKIEIQLDARRLVTHRRIAEAEHQRVMLAEHRPPRGERLPRPDPHPEEKAIVTAAPELAEYIAGLKQRSRKVVTLALRQLLRLVREYPREPLLGAVREAGRYGLYDLDRLERMILRRVTREYFPLDGESDE